MKQTSINGIVDTCTNAQSAIRVAYLLFVVKPLFSCSVAFKTYLFTFLDKTYSISSEFIVD